MHGEGTLDIKGRTLTGTWDKGCENSRDFRRDRVCRTKTPLSGYPSTIINTSFRLGNRLGMPSNVPSFHVPPSTLSPPARSTPRFAEFPTSTPRPMDTSVSCFLTEKGCMTAIGEVASVTARARLPSPTVMCTTVSPSPPCHILRSSEGITRLRPPCAFDSW